MITKRSRALAAIAGLLGGLAVLAAGGLEAGAQDKAKAAAPSAAPAQAAPAAPTGKVSGPNSFNRLMQKRSAKVNAPPAEDGIHDPANAGTQSLQWPAEAFQDLPKSNAGNRVDWVKAYDTGVIRPRFDLEDPEAEANVLELDIVREVKGSMPDVVYPHKPHTQWLDCTNCHDEIFVPEKGKNQISMAGILLGQQCGVCHGKVAFPVTDCRRCHSKAKTQEQLKGLTMAR